MLLLLLDSLLSFILFHDSDLLLVLQTALFFVLLFCLVVVDSVIITTSFPYPWSEYVQGILPTLLPCRLYPGYILSAHERKVYEVLQERRVLSWRITLLASFYREPHFPRFLDTFLPIGCRSTSLTNAVSRNLKGFRCTPKGVLEMGFGYSNYCVL